MHIHHDTSGPFAARPLATARLDLLPLRVEHAEEMAAVLSDPALHTFIGGAPATVQALRSRYRRLVAGSPDPTVTWGNWVIRLRGENCLTGTVQATISARGHGALAEVAWVVGTPWQRRGIATEAARGLVHWLTGEPVQPLQPLHPLQREQPKEAVEAVEPRAPRESRASRESMPVKAVDRVQTVVAHIHPGHRASAAVATAAGLAPTGERHDGEILWRRSITR